jgi:hypothetical protein
MSVSTGHMGGGRGWGGGVEWGGGGWGGESRLGYYANIF